jgi:hypothetical protein
MERWRGAVLSGTGTIVYGGCGGSGAFGDPYSFAPWRVVYLHLKQ